MAMGRSGQQNSTGVASTIFFFMEFQSEIDQLSHDFIRFHEGLARSERFELPTLGIEIRCSIQLSYERTPPYRNCGVPMSRDLAGRFPSSSIVAMIGHGRNHGGR